MSSLKMDSPAGQGALRQRLSTLTMVAMAFAILKYDLHITCKTPR